MKSSSRLALRAATQRCGFTEVRGWRADDKTVELAEMPAWLGIHNLCKLVGTN
jgi:hypothetical protein